MENNNKSKRTRFQKSISNITKNSNYIDVNKEQYLLNRLEQRLGKSKEELKSLLSDDLLKLLTIVPFTRK